MKTFKSVIALALALVLSLSVVSTAFAVNIGETIEWTYEYDYGEGTVTFNPTYKGELVEGSNNIKGDAYASPCYTFNAEKSGYYLFSSENGLFPYLSEEIIDGKPYGYADDVSGERKIDEDSGEYYSLFCIPEGIVYAEIGFYGDYADGTLEIEYLGAELTDVSIDENELKDLIKDYDIGYGSGKGFDFRTDATFTFDGENEVLLEGAFLRLDTVAGGEVVEGENIVKTINTFGVEKEYTLTCYSINHYVQKVEISNLDKYLTYKRYYGEDNYGDFGFYTSENGKGLSGETLTVTLCDGSTQSFVLESLYEEIEVELPNGRKVNVYMGGNYNPYEDKACFEVEICGVTVFEKECTAIEATAKENLEELKSAIRIGMIFIEYEIRFWTARVTEAESIGVAATYIKFMIDSIFMRINDIFTEIGDCCGHLILG